MKNVSGPEGSVFRKKGFFIALYSCLGAVAVLALVVAFANRGQPGQEELAYEQEETVYAGADQVEPYQAQAGHEAWFRPRQTPAPTPPPAPPAERPRPEPPAVPTPEPVPPVTAEPEPEPSQAEPSQAEPEPPSAPYQATPEPEPRAETFTPFSEDDHMVWPVYGDIAMPFSMTALVYDPTLDQFRTNDNLRIAADEGDPVRAAADGRVIAIGRNIVRGNYITVDHGDGWVATYGQLMDNHLVSVGGIVRAGQVIGGVGQPSAFGSLNGTHVHLRVTRNDTPVNPYELLQARE